MSSSSGHRLANVTFQNLAFPIVPEPGSGSLLVFGLALLARRGRS